MNTFTIAGRELRSMFHTTVGWLVLAAWLLVAGWFWAYVVDWFVENSVQMAANPYGETLDTTDHLLMPFFGDLSIILMLICPAIAMRLFSDELRNRTMELLFTSPVSTWEIVLGKFLGAMGYVGVMLLSTAYVPLTLLITGDPDWAPLFGGYLALFLMAGCIVAIGMMFSSWTNNAIVALIAGFSATMTLWLLSWAGGSPDDLAMQLSVATHIEDLVRGVVRLSDIVYYLVFIGFFVFATHQRVEAYRWS